jgi:23S rRNA pseudouridine1911/1915/1917 synthase
MGARDPDRGLHVLYSDNHLLVVAKPAGVPIVPDSSGDESLLDQARRWVELTFEKPGRAFLGVVHRLDRPVSGVVVFGRTSKGAARLSAQFAGTGVQKIYWGIMGRAPQGQEGILKQWLHKDRAANRVHVVGQETPDAREAVTRWRQLALDGERALVEFRPATGRSHQLRVAAATLGSPLLGDLKYGAGTPLPDRSIALHAQSLGFEHPTREQSLRFATPPPELEAWNLPLCQEARQAGDTVEGT